MAKPSSQNSSEQKNLKFKYSIFCEKNILEFKRKLRKNINEILKNLTFKLLWNKRRKKTWFLNKINTSWTKSIVKLTHLWDWSNLCSKRKYCFIYIYKKNRQQTITLRKVVVYFYRGPLPAETISKSGFYIIQLSPGGTEFPGQFSEHVNNNNNTKYFRAPEPVLCVIPWGSWRTHLCCC